MKIHEIFPILISQDKIDNHDEIKNEYLGELKSLWWNGYENPTPENSGRAFVHSNPRYFDIFKSISKSIRRHLDLLEIDHGDKSRHSYMVFEEYQIKNIRENNDFEPTELLNSHNLDSMMTMVSSIDKSSFSS